MTAATAQSCSCELELVDGYCQHCDYRCKDGKGTKENCNRCANLFNADYHA